MRPLYGARLPARVRRQVVLPTPLEPIRAGMLPAGISRDRFQRICTSPYPAFSPSTRTMLPPAPLFPAIAPILFPPAPGVTLAQVGGDHLFLPADLRGAALGDLPPVGHNT